MAREEAPQGTPGPKKVKKRDRSGKKINLRLIIQVFFFISNEVTNIIFNWNICRMANILSH